MSNDLRGRTLEVYKHLLRKGRPVGVREIQRALKLKSPSLALYHLKKLEEMGLVEKTYEGKYFVKNPVKVDVLKDFLIIGKYAVPRFLFYSVFTSSLTIFYISSINLGKATLGELLGLIIAVATSIIFWYETLRILRE